MQPDLRLLRLATETVLGAGHSSTRYLDRALAGGDEGGVRAAYERFRLLPPDDLRAIMALMGCESWRRRQAAPVADAGRMASGLRE